MDTLQTLFGINRPIILFIYGQVFFILGVAVALQSWHYSRLELARSLKWLAAFGILHGLHEWGDVFIPIQAIYLARPAVRLLYIVELFILAGSFACLFEFGVVLLRSFRRVLWLHGVSAALLLAWVFIVFFLVLPFSAEVEVWYRIANALARYFIGFPAAVLTAYGLRQHRIHRIDPLNAPHFSRLLKIAGISMLVYALLAGLIPPPVPFFPGNVVNTRSFTQLVGLPPLIFRSGVGLVLAVTFIQALRIFDIETRRLIESMEAERLLGEERERIGRELHDGAIQAVYTAGLIVESVRLRFGRDTQPAVRLDKAMHVLDGAIQDLRRRLVDPQSEETSQPLPQALTRLAGDPRFSSFVDVSVRCDLAGDASLSPEQTSHILSFVTEALSNTVKHAHARRVDIRVQGEAGWLGLDIHDDGVGFPNDPQQGFGMRNMLDRARLLGGRLAFHSERGATIHLEIPLEEH